MTAAHLIAVVEAAGGVLTLSPDGKHLVCRVPRRASALLDQVRRRRDELLDALTNADGYRPQKKDCKVSVGDATVACSASRDLINQWLRDRCVVSTRCASNPHLLYRAFLSWAEFPVSPTEVDFAAHLATLTFPITDEGMIPGLVLTEDFLAALAYERPLTSLPADEHRISTKGDIAMPLIVSTPPKQYERPDEGEHLAVLADFIDLGAVDTPFGKKEKVRFIWLVEQRDSEGKQIAVAHSYTKSLHEKASLRKAIKAILGRDVGTEFDLETMLGANMRLVIEHREYEGHVFAGIAAMLKPKKGETTLKIPPDFVRAKDRNCSSSGSNGKGVVPPNE